ncbi:ER membrane protein complex subunit 3 [Trichomonascus vanleenenianus]|uniref:ER membrane complex subunit EMC3 n=1 Tax=Trichomonascus vanleenenianus TaxID=2268995 RepID=UPI003ECAED16
MSVPDLVLDPSLRDWVLFPILLVMILVGVIRHYATQLLQPMPKRGDDSKAIREQQYLAYSALLRMNYSSLPQSAFANRQVQLCEKFKAGTFLKDPNATAASAGANMLSDPKSMEGMMGMMKGQIMMVVPQTLMMGWINAFFAGFVLMRLPFPLTIRFKSMMQSGVMTKDLDVRWVSSLSWYFLNLLGLQSVYSLILGSQNSAGGMAAMGATPTMMPQQPGTDFKKLYNAEAENLEIVHHYSIFDGIEKRVLKAA